MPKTRTQKRSRKPQPKSRRLTTSARTRGKTLRQEGLEMGKKVRRALEGAPRKATRSKASRRAMGAVKEIVDIGRAVAKDLRREAKSRLAKSRLAKRLR